MLLDVHQLAWETAWSLCLRIFSHTNYTLMKEALETWPVDVPSYMLLRQIGLIYETNARFLAEVHARFSTDNGLLRGICR
ncbi:MAG: starch phosphorylase [Rhodoferax sp.]